MPRREESYDATWGVKIGPWMKGVLIDGDVLSWRVNRKGQPHHDDIDPDARRSLELSFTGPYLSVTGFGPPIQFISDLLGWFIDYKNDTDIEVDVAVANTDILFIFMDTVGALKTYFKAHQPPDINDYEDEANDVEFLRDYDAWTNLPLQKKSVREILGRGGREDVWQEDEADASKSFSVYNPRRKKRC